MLQQHKSHIENTYFVNLDALRFFAATAVMLFHYILFFNDQQEYGWFYQNFFQYIIKRGHLGVNFFFVLSGFLITYLIILEINKNTKFDIWAFLIRRILRIWPLYFLAVSIMFCLVFYFPIYGETNHDIKYFMFFLSNFNEIINGENDSYGMLTIPWSVSIEEQFYLFFALIILPFQKQIKNFRYILWLLIAIGLVFLIIHFDNNRIRYYHTVPALIDLSFGAIVAFLFYYKSKIIDLIKSLSKTHKIILMFVFVIFIVFKNKIFDHGVIIALERPFIAIIFSFIIIMSTSNKLIFGRFHNKLQYLGKISYGIYMYHMVILFLFELFIKKHNINFDYSIIFITFMAILTILVSHWSYKYFEKVFLRLKSNFRKV